jgi:hypothetical protein
MPDNVFRFEIDSRFRLPLLGYGVTSGRAEVIVDEQTLQVRFGPWRVDTALTNISKVEVTGPYRWWKAIGIRMSLADKGITFGTSTASGVCIQLEEPVSVRLGRLRVPLRHPGITVTVADTSALSTLLRPGRRDG